MLEMVKYMEGGEAAYYGDMARRLVKALSDRCAVRCHEESNGLLLHGTYARASAGNPCSNRGVMSAIPGAIISIWRRLQDLRGIGSRTGINRIRNRIYNRISC